LLIVKYLFALLPLVWIFWKIDFGNLTVTIGEIAWWTLPAIVGLGLVLMFLQGMKWWLLLRAFMPAISLKEALVYHFKGNYYSIALPTSAAQDIVRTLLIARKNDYAVAWGATWVARISGLIVLVIISMYGLLTLDSVLLPKGAFQVLIVISILIMLMVLFSFSKTSTKLFRKIFRRFIPEKFLLIVENIRDGVYFYRNKKRHLVLVLLVTILIQFLMVFNAAMILNGITGKWFISECMAFIPIIEILCLSLPLTPNGIGIRDGLSALMFHQIALPVEQLGTYIILGFFTILLKLVGGIPILWEMIFRRGVKR